MERKKIEKKKEADRKYYERNRERKIGDVKEYKRKTGKTKVGLTRRSQQVKQKQPAAKKKKTEQKDVNEEREKNSAANSRKGKTITTETEARNSPKFG